MVKTALFEIIIEEISKRRARVYFPEETMTFAVFRILFLSL